MLHTETVEPGTFALLERLVRIEPLKDFCLVGGTALSLRYGHRKFNVEEKTNLSTIFGNPLRRASWSR